MKSLAIVITLAAATLCGAAHAASVHLVYGAYGAPTSTLVKYGIIPFIERTEKATNKSVTFDLEAGGALVNSTTALDAIGDGLVDASQIASIYYPSELPALNVTIDLSPGISADTRAVAAATTEFSILDCPQCKAEIEKFNIKYLGGYGVSAYSLLCRNPVKTLADLKGKRVRAAGAFGDLGTALGMVPVNIPSSEAYEGLQRGQLDCMMGSPGFMDTISLRDVAKNILLLKMGTAFGGPLLDVSLDAWNKLDDSQKEAMKHAAAYGVAKAATEYEAADLKVLDHAKDDGISVALPGDDIKKVLSDFAKERIGQVIAKAKSRNIPGAQEMVDNFMKILAKWQAFVDETHGDTQKLADKLYSDVYSKMN